MQVPAVAPALLSTQRAGLLQPGPLDVSQGPPSAAGATQMPLRLVPGR